MTAADVQEQICLPPIFSRVSQLIESKPEIFLVGDEEARVAALEATKYVFDQSLQREDSARSHVAQLLRSFQPSTPPETRSQKKRKRSPSPPPAPPETDEEIWRPTPLESLHLDGMDDEQVWAQLELRAVALCDILKEVLESGPDVVNDQDSDMEIDEEEGVEGSDESEQSDDLDDSEVEEDDAQPEEVTDLHDEETSEDDGDDDLSLDLSDSHPLPESTRGQVSGHRKNHAIHTTLDDDFFSLADFNAEIEDAEAKYVSNGRLSSDDEDSEVDNDDVDLFAPVGEGEDAFEEEDLEADTDPYYKDFFDPISHKASPGKLKNKKLSLDKGDRPSKVRFHDEVRVKKIKSRGKGIPVAFLKGGMFLEEEDDEYDDEEDGLAEVFDDEDEDAQDDGSENLAESEQGSFQGPETSQETIERFKDDLFVEDEETRPNDISTHEARQAEIAAQIAELEAQNVAPKQWTLMGEATSRSRPVNSLLEEDLEFERAKKVVPVVTEERVSSIEEIIKKRILDNHFDDVVRKRPVDVKAFLPSRFFELNDQKSTQSLAQIYEDEYSAAANGTAGVDDRDGKLKKEHEALQDMWENICHKLDALSNTHFTPKQPKATISTVSNLPTTTLESIVPTTKSVTTMLAPEEIFAAPSETRSRGELTPTEKRAQRNKIRKERKKARDRLTTSVDKFARSQAARKTAGSAKNEKEKALKSIVKVGKGVTVIGKKSAALKRPQSS